ncbi:unnamed protein product [Arabidopsis lyrata]|uniref:Predicted protein n=1 Tax=Arabidopsis lyrata subsp. lyrata TaxID=81972 RepID=D7KLW9_ARALL|nr:predicted protein [Arabidopsis lyrata subsp. lyrata]CAH8254515.1 unnamed protein product [Arabidopsis lyrata]
MLLAHPGWRSSSHKLEFVSTTIWAWSTLAAGGLPTIYHQTLHHQMRARDRYANGPVSRVLETINQLEAKGIMASVANISTLIQQNHPGARINLRESLNIAVKISRVTKNNSEEEGTPLFYVTRRGAQIDSFIDTSALAESKAYQKAATTSSIHNMRTTHGLCPEGF